MNKKILFIPLDERPCNRLFPNQIIEYTNGFTLFEPPLNILGNKKMPSDFKLLKAFILNNVSAADALIISIDQLLYGGIVPSRVHHLSTSELYSRLSLINEIKKTKPNIIIYAFALIMRCPTYSSSDEEPDYYETYGKEINQIGSLIHKNMDYSHLLIDELKEYLSDYMDRRKTNLLMVKETISLLSKGVIDYLIIPQDDSQVSGFTAMDKEVIFKETSKFNSNQIGIYPGADEVGLTLISRIINKLNCSSKRIYIDPLYSESLSLIPSYENMPLYSTIENQIKASLNIITNSYDDADIVLFINYNKDRQDEAYTQGDITNKDIVLSQLERIKKAKKDGKTVGLVDKYYVNGGNLKYMDMLYKTIGFSYIDSYASWNTSSNSLGTVISFATILSYSNNPQNRNKFFAQRIYDDLIYQGYVRNYISSNILDNLGLTIFDLKGKEEYITKIAKEKIEEYAKTHFPILYSDYKIERIELPWRRMFEVDIEVE